MRVVATPPFHSGRIVGIIATTVFVFAVVILAAYLWTRGVSSLDIYVITGAIFLIGFSLLDIKSEAPAERAVRVPAAVFDALPQREAMHTKMMEHLEQHIIWPATKRDLLTTANMHRDDASFPADERQKMIKAIEELPDDPNKRYTMAEFRQKMGA